MVRNDAHSDDDDFMPARGDAVAAGKRIANKKTPRNRGSQERLTDLYDDFNDGQKDAAKDMGMQTLMNIRSTILRNSVCDWLARMYEPESREFVIPGRGRIPLDEESVFNTLGVPRGGMDVPYRVDRTVQDRLFPEMFPGLKSLPLTSVVATMLSEMESSDQDFKRKLLMYLISTVFAPTTSTRPSSRCFPILGMIDNVVNMNWCKFIAGFLHTAFSKKIYNKGCRLHLMLMYVDRLDLSTLKLNPVGGLPPPHKFAAAAWSDAAIKAVLAADRKPDGTFGKLQLMGKHSVDFSFFGGPQNFSKWMDVHTSESCSLEARNNVEHLVGQFASGMTSLLGNLVQGWTAMSAGDGDEVANQFRTFVRGGTSRPIGSRGRYDYNDSQELPDSEEEFLNDGDDSDDDDERVDDGNAGDVVGSAGDVDMDHEHDFENQQSRGAHDDAEAGKVPAGAPAAGAPAASTAQVSKRVRDTGVTDPVSNAKRLKIDPVAARRSEVTAGGRASKQKTVDIPSRSSARLNKGPPIGTGSAPEVAHSITRSSPRLASSNTGDPVVLLDMRDAGKRNRQKKKDKKVAPVDKTKKQDPLKRIHSKLAPSHNADTGKTSETGSAATSAPAPTISAAPVAFLSSIATALAADVGVRGGVSEELISPRTVEAAPTLVSMRQGAAGVANIPDGGRDSNNDLDNIVVDGTSLNRGSEQAFPPAAAGTRVVGATIVQNKDAVVTQETGQMDPQAETVPATNAAGTTTRAASQITSKTVVCTRKSPRKKAASTNSAQDQDGKRDATRYIPASSLFPPAAQSKAAASAQAKGHGDATIQQPSVSRVDKLPASPRLQHTHVPLNMGVPYTPTIDQHGKGTGKKTVIDIPDTTPRPPVRPKSVGSDGNEMFVDLSPLAAAKAFLQKQSEHKERHPMDFTPPSCSLGLDLSQTEQPVDAVPVSYALPIDVAPMMAQLNVDGRKAVKFAEPVVQGSPDEISPSLDEAYCKMEEDALMRKKIHTQVPSMSSVAEDMPSDDVHSSVTPGSVRQARVVQPPPEVDNEPPIKATKQQQALYDLVKRFGNARSNSVHMKEIRKTKVIQCNSTYVDLGDLAESVKPNGKLSRNVVVAGVEYINEHTDINGDKIIMSPTITRRIWEGDFFHAEVRKVFAQHGHFKLTMKHFVMFTMFQELAPNDPKDKAGHYYMVCLNLAKQRFDVLDSLRSGDDPTLRSHAEFFINNLKQTWLRHYSGSKVQINNYPIEYVKSMKQGNSHDCGFYLLEYLAKWEGRKVPTLTKDIISELRKIYTWNWVTNLEFNKREGAKAWIEESVKAAVKRYR